MQTNSVLDFSISPTIFRAYDIRGIYGDTLTDEIAYQIGLALGSEAQVRGNSHIILARDGRNSSPILSMALGQGLLATGCHVIDIGAVPTPVLYFATHFLSTNSGVMLTGSHNPAEYNGMKIVLGGKTLSEEEIKNLYSRIINQDYIYGRGDISESEVLPQYIAHINQDIKLSRKLKVVIDCANGIAGQFAPDLIRQLGCEVIELFCDVDGNFPNHDPDPSQPINLATLIAEVKKHKADIGIAFDGDGDRLGVITNQGQIIWPDRQMMLFAKEILHEHAGAKIIFDVKCTRNLIEVVKNFGGEPIMWKTGHSLIKAKMEETQAMFAGEMSGHFFFKHRWFGFDDGIYAAARLLEIIAKDSSDVDTIFKKFPNSVNTPEIKLAIAETEKFIFMEKFIANASFTDAQINHIDGIRVDFSYGWGLIRPSNTTPYLILRFEAGDETILELIKNQFRKQILAIAPAMIVPF